MYSNLFSKCLKQSRRDTMSDCLLTPALQDDFRTISPIRDVLNASDITSDISDVDFDRICDVTVREIRESDDKIIDTSYVTISEVRNILDTNSLEYLYESSNSTPKLVDRPKDSLLLTTGTVNAINRLDSNVSISTAQSSGTERDTGYETSSVKSDTDKVVPLKHTLSGPVLTGDIPTQNILGANHARSNKRKPIQIVSPTTRSGHRILAKSTSTFTDVHPKVALPKHIQGGQLVNALKLILLKRQQAFRALELNNRRLMATKQLKEYNFIQKKTGLEDRIQKLTKECNTLYDREKRLVEQLNLLTARNIQMSIVQEEFQQALATEITKQVKEKLERQIKLEQLATETDVAVKHISFLNSALTSTLSKYDHEKNLLLKAKKRQAESQLKILDLENRLKQYNDVYNNLRLIAKEKLQKTFETITNMKKAESDKIARLNATLKMHEDKIVVLEKTLQTKNREHQDLLNLYRKLTKLEAQK